MPYPAGMMAPAVTSAQYHAQDEFGQARFGYAHPGQAANNMRDAFGNQMGSYSYINPEGKQVMVSYTADSRGFRVLSNDLPVAPVANLLAPLPVQDTPEVAQAKATHMAALAAAKMATVPAAPAPVVPAPVPVAPIDQLPVQVMDTPEVAAAKREHAAKWLAAKNAADSANLRKSSVPSIDYGYGAPFGYNFPYGAPYNLF